MIIALLPPCVLIHVNGRNRPRGARFDRLSLAPAAALAISHGVSFFVNLLGRREFAGRTMKDMMMAPYMRVAPMFLMALALGIAVTTLGDLRVVAAAAVVIETVLDLKGHWRERLARHRALDAGRGTSGTRPAELR